MQLKGIEFQNKLTPYILSMTAFVVSLSMWQNKFYVVTNDFYNVIK